MAKSAKKIDLKKRHFSLALLLAIPCSFFLAVFGLLVLITILTNYPSQKTTHEPVWGLFACGFLGTSLLTFGLRFAWLETFIHELKHAVIVILSGNRLKAFSVSSTAGHVEYELEADELHLTPFIMLAPYYLPLFSIPTLIACIVFEGELTNYLSLALGITLALDLLTSLKELHPAQSDLKRILGGFLSAGSFIAGVLSLWTVLCLLWVANGREAYIQAFKALWRVLNIAVFSK